MYIIVSRLLFVGYYFVWHWPIHRCKQAGDLGSLMVLICISIFIIIFFFIMALLYKDAQVTYIVPYKGNLSFAINILMEWVVSILENNYPTSHPVASASHGLRKIFCMWVTLHVFTFVVYVCIHVTFFWSVITFYCIYFIKKSVTLEKQAAGVWVVWLIELSRVY